MRKLSENLEKAVKSYSIILTGKNNGTGRKIYPEFIPLEIFLGDILKLEMERIDIEECEYYIEKYINK